MLQVQFSLALLSLVCGCTKSPLGFIKVSGTVKYADGSIPVAEYRLIRFEPVADASGHTGRGAYAEVQTNGTFQATTIQPGDGMKAGDYKVVLLFWKSYLKRDSVLPAAYSNSQTTPLKTISVKTSGTNHFDFILPSPKTATFPPKKGGSSLVGACMLLDCSG